MNSDSNHEGEEERHLSNDPISSVGKFLDWYRQRKRVAMINDAKLSLSEYSVKIGIILGSFLIDLIFLPSLIQLFIPISLTFFIVCLVCLSILVYLEKQLLSKVTR